MVIFCSSFKRLKYIPSKIHKTKSLKLINFVKKQNNILLQKKQKKFEKRDIFKRFIQQILLLKNALKKIFVLFLNKNFI